MVAKWRYTLLGKDGVFWLYIHTCQMSMSTNLLHSAAYHVNTFLHLCQYLSSFMSIPVGHGFDFFLTFISFSFSVCPLLGTCLLTVCTHKCMHFYQRNDLFFFYPLLALPCSFPGFTELFIAYSVVKWEKGGIFPHVSMTYSNWELATLWTHDLLNTSQTLLPLSHLNPWQRSRRQATWAAFPRGLSWIPIDSHSQLHALCLVCITVAHVG